MQFNQITYFLSTCETLNFTRAAEMCHVTQPSLSAAIQKLEDELGGALFDRDGRSITLTPLGESMRIHLSQIQHAKDAASLAALNMVQGSVNVINMGFMCTLSPRRLLTAIAAFSQERPSDEILIHEVQESNALQLLQTGVLDCLILARTKDLPDRFQEQPLAEEPIVLAMHKTHPLLSLNRISCSDLQDQYYVDRLHCEFREMFFEELGSRNFSINTVLRSERDDIVEQSVLEGIGVSVMPKSTAENAGLVTRPLSDMSIQRSIGVVTLKDREANPALCTLIDHICVAFSDI